MRKNVEEIWCLINLGESGEYNPWQYQRGTLYALAKQSKNLGAFKLARYAYEKLQSLRIPSRFQEAVDVGSVMIRSKAFQDHDVCNSDYIVLLWLVLV